jgi:hypothetical protein
MNSQSKYEKCKLEKYKLKYLPLFNKYSNSNNLYGGEGLKKLEPI